MEKDPQSKAVLNSWKEIACFFDRGVRTVQRWERDLGLPVHRVRRTEHSPVFAYVKELQFWLQSRSVQEGTAPAALPARRRDPLEHAHIQHRARNEADRSRRLTRDLASLVMEQRNRAEVLARNLKLTAAGLRQLRNRADGDRDISEGGELAGGTGALNGA